MRRAVDTVLDPYRQDPEHALALLNLVQETSSLCARRLEKQDGWHALLARALAERKGSGTPAGLAQSVLAAAALDCLNAALEHWAAAEGRSDLTALIDEAFAVLAR
ncbi:acyl-CoA-like ligand-binding transcription factor [Streptomyces jumonjinensis]|uniref:acyl-CoA-like ligand-binding transcription factor n=1 Tax=Streptomyces jumonjinensis TaxID=1945 RepID=UPI0018865A98|nr:hypothetical protein [Streptomyces jumonjinensis]